jgi:hypothetical protein
LTADNIHGSNHLLLVEAASTIRKKTAFESAVMALSKRRSDAASIFMLVVEDQRRVRLFYSVVTPAIKICVIPLAKRSLWSPVPQ